MDGEVILGPTDSQRLTEHAGSVTATMVFSLSLF